MERLEAVETTRQVLVRESVEVEAFPARDFLRLPGTGPRGFWGRGRGWIAHLGSLGELTPEEPGSDGKGGTDARFQKLWRSALGRSGWRADPQGWSEAHAPRWYGGLAFGRDHRAEGAWSDFPAARFVLPELEAEAGHDGVTLRAQALVGPDHDQADVRESLARRLEEVMAGVREIAPAADAPERGGVDPDEEPAYWTDADRQAWEEAVEEGLDSIRAGAFHKVVLARILDVHPGKDLDPVTVLAHLWRQNPGGHVYLFEPAPGSFLVGAAPEVLADLRDGVFRATAVAGSVAHGETPEEQEALARRLLESRKDRSEHAYTVDDMVERLRARAGDVDTDVEPHVLTLSGIQHLETRIRARVGSDENVLALLETLHPTPAVCGFPRDPALRFLRYEEPFERGWYAGPVGWFDLEGQGVFVPALRSAVVRNGAWRLFAGAGIVEGSDPTLEWEETRIKFAPVLRALAAAGA